MTPTSRPLHDLQILHDVSKAKTPSCDVNFAYCHVMCALCECMCARLAVEIGLQVSLLVKALMERAAKKIDKEKAR